MKALAVICMVAGCIDSGVADEAPRHCVASASVQLTPDDPGTPMGEVRCYDTLARSLAAATDGAVEVSDAATSEEIQAALAKVDYSGALPPPQVIAIEYVAPRFDAFWGTWTVTSRTRCADTWAINFWNLSEHGFNDRISSALILPGCANAYHYEHANMVGAWTLCRENSFDCYANMVYLDDRISSISFTNFF